MLFPLLLTLAATPDFAEMKLDRRSFDYGIVGALAEGLNAAPISKDSTRFNLQELSGEVRAELTTRALAQVKGHLELNGKNQFADKTLEAKPKWWKFCFRVGPEATKAARDFATSWLAELNAPASPSRLSGEK